MIDSKVKSQVQERIVNLYLRLNGYFQSGLIIHSQEWGDNYGEIDRIGVRFGGHDQVERQVECDSCLGIDDSNIDLVIVEVKNKFKGFNKSLLVPPKSDFAWHQIITWAGMLKEDLDELLSKGPDLVSDVEGTISEYVVNSKTYGKIRTRPIYFIFEGNPDLTKIGYLVLTGSQVFDYICECLLPIVKRETCSTTYPYDLWGNEYSDIVANLKNKLKNGEDLGTIHTLITELM